MIREASLTSPYTKLDILFLPSVAPIFPPQSWSYHSKLPLYRWGYSTGILSTHRNCTVGATNHTKISDFASLSLNLIIEYMITLHLNTYYFIPTAITTIKQNLNSFKCMIIGTSLTSLCHWHSAGILSTHWCYTVGAINHTKISDFASISLNLHHWVHDYFTSK